MANCRTNEQTSKQTVKETEYTQMKVASTQRASKESRARTIINLATVDETLGANKPRLRADYGSY